MATKKNMPEMVSGWCDVAAYAKALARNLRREGIKARALNTARSRASAAGDPTHQKHLELFVPVTDLAMAKRYLTSTGLPKAARALSAQ